jgi:hypothetical protein
VKVSRNKQRRQEALDRYYANPKCCAYCNQIIPVPDGVKTWHVRIKQFCTRKCANTFNNRQRIGQPREKRRRSRTKPIQVSNCQLCGAEVTSRSKVRKYCNNCRNSLPQTTKGELLARTSNWQSANSIIRKQARHLFLRSGRELACQVCGYAIHVNIAHIRAVSAFPDAATIAEINNLDNLAALCPNHHWEVDHGLRHLR